MNLNDCLHEHYESDSHGCPMTYSPRYTGNRACNCGAEAKNKTITDAAAEIERLQAEIEGFKESLDEDYNRTEDALVRLENENATLRQKVAELEKLVPRWIPVSERLPEDESVVIVWIGEEAAAAKGHEVQVARAHLAKDGDEYAVAPVTFSFKRAGFLGGNEVTHWMPLPTTPQEVKE